MKRYVHEAIILILLIITMFLAAFTLRSQIESSQTLDKISGTLSEWGLDQ